MKASRGALVAAGSARRRVRCEHDAGVVPQPASFGRRLFLGDVEDRDFGHATVESVVQRGFVDERSATDVHEHRTSAEQLEPPAVEEVPGVVAARRGEHDHIGPRQHGVEVLRAEALVDVLDVRPANASRRARWPRTPWPGSPLRCRCCRDRRPATSSRGPLGSRATAIGARVAPRSRPRPAGSGRARHA